MAARLSAVEKAQRDAAGWEKRLQAAEAAGHKARGKEEVASARARALQEEVEEERQRRIAAEARVGALVAERAALHQQIEVLQVMRAEMEKARDKQEEAKEEQRLDFRLMRMLAEDALASRRPPPPP